MCWCLTGQARVPACVGGCVWCVHANGTVPEVANLSAEVQEVLGVEGAYQEFIRVQEKEVEVLKREVRASA